MVNPTTVERESMTVVGLQTHYEGDESVFSELWAEFGERWDEFDGLAATDEAFGVVTDFDEDTTAFDYLAGVATTDVEAVPDDYVVVDVPGGQYSVFETTLGSFEADYDEVREEWLGESGFERRPGPEFERYGPAFDPEEPDSPYEYFLPVVAPT